MQLQTILNRVQRHQSFVYRQARFRDGGDGPALDVQVEPRANGRPICSGCGKKGPGYDRLAARRFQFVPRWGIAVFFVYALRRVDCPRCGVKAEQVPWASGKEHVTTMYQWFLARWAKRLPWQEVADVFRTSWNTVYRAVTLAALWGMANRSLEGITAIGIDEIQWRKGHKYLSWSTRSRRGASGCGTSLPTGRQRACAGSSRCWGRPGPRPWSSPAATCGSHTWR
jgi:transposase